MLKRRRELLFLLFLCVVLGVLGWILLRPTAERAAKSDLKALKQFIVKQTGPTAANQTKQVLETLGLHTTGEISSLELGDPIREYRVDFAKLKRFQSGDDPEKVLVNTNRVTYPLQVGHEVRSSLTVRESKDGKKWKTGGWGSPNFAPRLLKYRKQKSDFLVCIIELNLCFLGSGTGRELKLTPVGDLPRYDLRAGQILPAETVFSRLQPAAKGRKAGIR